MPIDSGYRSEMDQFLETFDEQPAAHSDTRAAEEAKYKRVHDLRDNKKKDKENNKLWSDF